MMEEMFNRMMATMTQTMQQQQQFMQQQFIQFQQMSMQQQQQELSQVRINVRGNDRDEIGAQPVNYTRAGRSDLTHSNHSVERQAEAMLISPVRDLQLIGSSSSVPVIASQISEFGGTETENVKLWVQRVNQIARVHNARDSIVLLAATSKLTGEARRWYDFQIGPVLESWEILSDQLVRMFDQQVPFYVTMQQIENRKWLCSKETFDQYAMDKLALVQRLNLPESDVINLLIGGITISSLSATALTLSVNTVDQFLLQMRSITRSYFRSEKPASPSNKTYTNKDIQCRKCNKKGHIARNCVDTPEISCALLYWI